MKKYFAIILSIVPSLFYCQLDHCSYNTSNIPSNYYKYLQGIYLNDSEVDKIILDITTMLGLEKNFVYVNSPGINNCIALNYEGIRFILYDKSFLNNLSQNKSLKLSVYISVLAHEIGHHLQGHTLKTTSAMDAKLNELEADKFSGFIMAKFGYSLSEAQEGINSLPHTFSRTHPEKEKRLAAIKEGYEITIKRDTYFIDKLKNELLNTLFVEYFMKGQEELRNNNFENAVDNFTTSITLNKGNNFFPIALRAIAYSKSSLYSKALNDFSKLENIEVNDNLAKGDYLYFNRGVTYEEMEKFSNASKDFYKAYEFNEKDKIALMKFAVNQTKSGNHESAILAFEFQLTDDDINNSGLENFTKGDVYYYKALSYFEDNDYTYSQKYFEEAKKLYPKEYTRLALPYFYLGKIYEKYNDNEKAIEQYLAFLEINKKEQTYMMYDINYVKANEVYLILGNIYQSLGNYELSTKYTNVLIERTPKSPNPYVVRGLNYYFINNLEDAEKDFLLSCNLGSTKGCDLLKQSQNNSIPKDLVNNFKLINGGYKANKIVEHIYNASTKDYDLSSEVNVESKLFFGLNNYSFKRGENKWLFANWTYKEYDPVSKMHLYYDNYNQFITINKDFKTITWYTDKVNEIYQKIIVYSQLTQDNSITPEE